MIERKKKYIPLKLTGFTFNYLRFCPKEIFLIPAYYCHIIILNALCYNLWSNRWNKNDNKMIYAKLESHNEIWCRQNLFGVVTDDTQAKPMRC